MKKVYFITTLLLALILSACGAGSSPTPLPTVVLDNSSNSPSTNNNVTRPVSSGGAITASAIVVSAQEADMAFTIPGNIKSVNVSVGDQVKAAQVLLEQENSLAQMDVDQAQRTLRELTSQAAIASAEQEVANAQQTYDDAKKKLDGVQNRHADNVTIDYLKDQVTLAQNNLDRVRDAYKRTSRRSVVDPARAKAATDLYNAQKAYNNALSDLNWYANPPSVNDVAIATADLDAATADLQEAKWYLSELKGESIPGDATGAELTQLQQAEDDLQAAQARLDQTRLVAPFAGIVGAVNTSVGEYASPGQTMLTISDTAHMQVETTDLSERDVTKIQIGDSAQIFIEALNTTVDGKVINIAPLSDTVGGDVVYKVTLSFEKQPEGLLRGMSAEVTIGG